MKRAGPVMWHVTGQQEEGNERVMGERFKLVVAVHLFLV